MRGIADELDKRKVPTVSGGAWRPQTVIRIVERLLGMRLFRTSACLAVLLIIYEIEYSLHIDHPGGTNPLGWWAWQDQGFYMKSAIALAHGNFSPAEHWYPLGYSLLALPFVRFTHTYAFLIPNLVCLTAAAVAWEYLCRCFRVPQLVAWLLFAASLLIDRRVFDAFVIPWSTTPIVPYLYAALYFVLRQQRLSPVAAGLCGACAAAVLVTRPIDVLLFVPVALAAIYRLTEHDLRSALRITGAAVGGFAAVLVPYAALHATIYGMHVSDYMNGTNNIGFDFRPLAEKLFAFFVDPLPLYGEGEPILHRSPWIVLAPFGMVMLCWRFGWRGAVLLAVTLINVITYTAYVDLDPMKIFHYGNIHYFKVVFPILMLASVYGVLAVVRERRLIPVAAAACLTTLAIRYEVRFTPANVSVVDKDHLKISCASCGPAEVIVLTPAKISEDASIRPDTYAQVGPTLLRSFFQFRFKRVGDELVLVFPQPIKSNAVTLTFKDPGHEYAPDHPPAALVGRGSFRLSVPRLP